MSFYSATVRSTTYHMPVSSSDRYVTPKNGIVEQVAIMIDTDESGSA